jgi:nitroreductase
MRNSEPFSSLGYQKSANLTFQEPVMPEAEKMTLSAVEVNRLKHAPPVDGVLPPVLGRWSPRSFTHQEVSEKDLAKIFEAARWTASSSNEQPWHYLVGIRPVPSHAATYEKIFAALVDANKLWAGSAPVLILGVARTTFARSGASNAYALYDLGAATSYLTLQASALGVATHQMAGFDHDAARQSFNIPSDYALGSVIALGYQGEPSDLPSEQLVAREIAARTRKPLKEFVLSAWGEPSSLGL